MSRRRVSRSRRSSIEINTHLAINTIGGDFVMEVNMCPWTPASLVFFFVGPRGKCSVALRPSARFAKNEAKWKQGKIS